MPGSHSRVPGSARERATALLGIAAAGTVVLPVAATAAPRRSPSPSDAIYRAVFRHLVTNAVASGEDARTYIFRYRLLLPGGQGALRLVRDLDPVRAAEEQLAEWHLYDEVPVRRTTLSPALRRSLEHIARASMGRRLSLRRGRKEGTLAFQAGQIRWNGRDQAVVEAGRAYTFFEKRDGMLLAWSYCLRKTGGSWRIESRKSNLAAG